MAIAKVKATGKFIEIYRAYNGKFHDIDKHSFEEDEIEFLDHFSNKLEKVCWVGRDDRGYINLFQEEPEYDNYTGEFHVGGDTGMYLGWKNVLPDVKENEKKQIIMQLSI